MIGNFRKKPVVIQAVRYSGHNESEIRQFVQMPGLTFRDGDELMPPAVMIPTLEGVMKCGVGDWIIKGVKGEFYPCKPEIFTATYEAV